MKTNKLLTAIVAVFFFSNLLLAGNPKTSSSEDNLANIMITKLSKDVVLTDSQKIVIQQNAKAFVIKMQNANALGNKDDKTNSKRQAYNDYKASLDSLLTNGQREQLKTKIKERENAK